MLDVRAKQQPVIVSNCDGIVIPFHYSFKLTNNVFSKGNSGPVVRGLVVQLNKIISIGLLTAFSRHDVKLCGAHAAAEDVAGHGAVVEREALALDDLEAAVRGEGRPLLEQLFAVFALRKVFGALGGHRELEAKLARAEHKDGVDAAPAEDLRLGVLDDNVHGVHVLLHKAKVVLVVLQRLGQKVVDEVALADAREVARRGEECHVHVEVVCVLNALHDLLDLVLEVDHAGLAHHKVVLECDREALAHGVAREGLLALCERARRALVRHARGESLVEAPHVPLDLTIGVLKVLVREDGRGKRGVRGVSDEAVDPVRDELVVSNEHVREVHARVLAVATLVGGNVVSARAEHVSPVIGGWTR